jgi:hypothetical protein
MLISVAAALLAALLFGTPVAQGSLSVTGPAATVSADLSAGGPPGSPQGVDLSAGGPPG